MSIEEFLAILRRGQRYKHTDNRHDPMTGLSWYRYDDEYIVNLGFINATTNAEYGHTYSLPVAAFEPDLDESEE